MKTLSIVIPVYNEAERLKKTFQALAAGLSSQVFVLREVIFVNDGSTDTTLKVLQDWKKNSGVTVKIVSYVENRGKGYAVKRGMIVANAEYVLLVDADMSTPLTELAKLELFIQQGYQVVVGTRKNGHSTVMIPQPLYRQIAGRVFTKLSNVILNVWVSDFTCGFKLFSKQAKKKIFEKTIVDHWGYDAEILFLAKKYGYPVQEKAVLWYNDARSKVHFVRDVLSSFSELVQIRVNDFRGGYTPKVDHDNLGKEESSWVFSLLQS